MGLLRGESTISEADDRAGVDRSTVMKLRLVAKQVGFELSEAVRTAAPIRATGHHPMRPRDARDGRVCDVSLFESR